MACQTRRWLFVRRPSAGDRFARAWLDCGRDILRVDLDEEIVVFSPARSVDQGSGHRQVELTDRDGAVQRVDAGLAPLLAELWTRGWRTHASCEATPQGETQVVFSDHADAEAFVSAVFGDSRSARPG